MTFFWKHPCSRFQTLSLIFMKAWHLFVVRYLHYLQYPSNNLSVMWWSVFTEGYSKLCISNHLAVKLAYFSKIGFKAILSSFVTNVKTILSLTKNKWNKVASYRETRASWILPSFIARCGRPEKPSVKNKNRQGESDSTFLKPRRWNTYVS